MRLDERFWTKVDRRGPDECWPWLSARDDGGYPIFWLGGGVSGKAHRLVYEDQVGAIPEGLTLDHTCHNADRSCSGGPTCEHRRCVNPTHLEPCPKGENARRSHNAPYNVKAAQTHCKRGHEFDEKNTAIHNGRRECRACAAQRARERRKS